MGCSVIYPVGILTFGLVGLSRSYHHFPEPVFHQSLLFMVSLIFGALQLVKYRSSSRSPVFKITIKVLLGISIGGFGIWVITLSAPVHVILLVVLFGLILLSFIGTFRIMYLNRMCAGCIYHGDWDICYGFRGLNRYHYIKHIRSRRKLIDMIFDKNMKRSYGIRTGPPASIYDEEPELVDEDRWVLKENMIFPWIPRTERLITSKDQLGRSHK